MWQKRDGSGVRKTGLRRDGEGEVTTVLADGIVAAVFVEDIFGGWLAVCMRVLRLEGFVPGGGRAAWALFWHRLFSLCFISYGEGK